jgi:hypothetical protein
MGAKGLFMVRGSGPVGFHLATQSKASESKRNHFVAQSKVYEGKRKHSVVKSKTSEAKRKHFVVEPKTNEAKRKDSKANENYRKENEPLKRFVGV